MGKTTITLQIVGVWCEIAKDIMQSKTISNASVKDFCHDEFK